MSDRITRLAESLVKTAAAVDLPHNVKPGSVFAYKSGRYTNSGLDMGSYEETRTLSVAITYEDGNVYGWYDLHRMGQQNREEAKGKSFGALEGVSESMISSWVSGLFRSAGIDEPNGWAGPSMGHGSYRLGQLLDMQKRGKIEELRSEAGNLTWAEKVVLSSFGYKPSYAGVRDYRKYESMRQTSITDEEYEAARDSLKRRGFIRPNNALSPLGKEAREGMNVQMWQLKNRTSSVKTANPLIDRLQRLIDENNAKYGTNFSIGNTYGNWELWANFGGGDHRLEAGSAKDVYNAFVKYRFAEKFRNRMASTKHTAATGDLCFYVTGSNDIYVVNGRGEIATRQLDWKHSPRWIFKGVSLHHWRNGIDVPFNPRTDPKAYVGGYVWDSDHGSTRTWSNRKIVQAWRDTADDAERREYNKRFASEVVWQAPSGVNEAAWEKWLSDVSPELERVLKSASVRVLKIDPNSPAHRSYLHLEKAGRRFELPIRDVQSPKAVVELEGCLRKFDRVVKAFESLDGQKDPFYSSVYDAVKAHFGDGQGKHVAYGIICDWITQSGRRIWSSDKTAAAGISDSAFRSRVYRIMQKMARKYGGTASGMVAAGDLDDGGRWSATITRHSASNGETFGRLELTVTRPGVSPQKFADFWDWNKMFEKAGIPVVNPGVIASSNDAMSWARNLAHNYAHGIGGDIQAQLLKAIDELGLDRSDFDRRWRHVQDMDLRTKEGMHFLLTGNRHPGACGYTWASDQNVKNSGDEPGKKEEGSMSRERMTSRERGASDLLQAVEVLERSVKAVDEKGLDSEADKAAKADKQTVNESRPAGPANLKDQGDQNAKANKNWPVSEADKVKVAKRLVTLARELLSE